MTLRVRAKVLLHVWSYGFYDMTFYKATSYDKKNFSNIVCEKTVPYFSDKY